MKTVAVIPGSFDPVTVGHIDLIRRAASLFGSCLVLVMNNREKTYRFSLRQRYEMCCAAFREDERIRVDFSEGMLYEYLLNQKEKTVLVKGIRNEKDYLYEKKMAEFNFEHCGVETLYLDAKDEFRSVSSTLVRQKMENGEDVSQVLSQEVIKHLQNKM